MLPEIKGFFQGGFKQCFSTRTMEPLGHLAGTSGGASQHPTVPSTASQHGLARPPGGIRGRQKLQLKAKDRGSQVQGGRWAGVVTAQSLRSRHWGLWASPAGPEATELAFVSLKNRVMPRVG